MGVDVVLKARLHEPPMSAEAFEDLQRVFRERYPADGIYSDSDKRYPDLGFDKWEPVQTIDLATMWRYYGVGYERGPWGAIKEMGDWLASTLGEVAEVRYGGDSADEWEYLTPWPDARRECDEHFRKVGHEPYEAAFRRFQK